MPDKDDSARFNTREPEFSDLLGLFPDPFTGLLGIWSFVIEIAASIIWIAIRSRHIMLKSQPE